MAVTASVAGLNALALVASSLPNINPPTPIYAIVQSDTFLPLTIPSSWGSFAPKYETAMSDYAQEQGAFQVYNKVARPQTVTVTLIKTGSDVARFAWLAAIRQMEAQFPTQLYTLISPQDVFIDYAIQRMSYETRKERGTNMLYLDIVFAQIPQIPSATPSNTVAPKSGPVQQIGQLFTQALTTAQNALVAAGTFLTI